jgi:hypothetical protein
VADFNFAWVSSKTDCRKLLFLCKPWTKLRRFNPTKNVTGMRKTFPKLLTSKLTLRLKRQVKRAKELKLSLAPFDRQLLIDSHCNLLNSLGAVQIVTPYYDTSVRKYIQWFFNRLNNSVYWFSNSHVNDTIIKQCRCFFLYYLGFCHENTLTGFERSKLYQIIFKKL